MIFLTVLILLRRCTIRVAKSQFYAGGMFEYQLPPEITCPANSGHCSSEV